MASYVTEKLAQECFNMAWTNQGRSGGLVSLPGTSPARLSSIRERRVTAAKTPWTPTQPTAQPTLQDPPSKVQRASSTARTSKFTMSKATCIEKIQANAAPGQPLVTQSVKASGGSVHLHFTSGFYSLAIQPSFSTLSKGFSLMVEGTQVTLPKAPIVNRDQGGLLVDIQLQFLVSTPAGPQRTAQLFLYPTTTSLQVQGCAKFTKKTESPTVAEWFVACFVLPRIEAEVARKHINSKEVTAVNEAILKMNTAPPSHITSVSCLPEATLQSGANRPTVRGMCCQCNKQLDGRTARSAGFPVCAVCKKFLHSGCQSDHNCQQTADEESDCDDLEQDLTNDSLLFSTPSPANDTYRAALTSPPSPMPAPKALTFESPAQTNLPPLAPATVPFPPATPSTAASETLHNNPQVPVQKLKNQNSKKSGLALSAGSLDLEVSQRALFLCKEDLALKESILRDSQTKNNVLVDRVKLLEAEVTKLLADKHLQDKGSPAAPNTSPEISPHAPKCSLCQQVASDIKEIQGQVRALTTAVYLIQKPRPHSPLQSSPFLTRSRTPTLVSAPPQLRIPCLQPTASLPPPTSQPRPRLFPVPPPWPHLLANYAAPSPQTRQHMPNPGMQAPRVQHPVPLMSLIIPRPPRLHPRSRTPHPRKRNSLFRSIVNPTSESPVIENLRSLN